MKFQHFDEAEKTVRAINEELRFIAHFGEMSFPARCSVRKEARRGTAVYSLNNWLATAACSVPSNCDISYLKPTSQLGMDAIEAIGKYYRRMTVRKKEKQTPAEKRMQEFADKTIK